jgi:hypothetical protein
MRFGFDGVKMIVVSGNAGVCAKEAAAEKSARKRKRLIRYVFLEHPMTLNYNTLILQKIPKNIYGNVQSDQ